MYTTVIGLEVHVQLATKSKLFCGCSTAYGAEPNTQTCPVCIGMPGSLPVMNEEAVALAIETGLALNLQIAKFTKWDRKQYFYPDLPKGYQISQYDLPITHDGWLEIEDPKGAFEPKKIRILRAHLEEDAGKSLHDESAGKGDTLIDLNRTGTPLLEIVSEPDLRSSAEAKAYLTELRLLLTYLGVSDCNMQEGSLRVDANVNLHIPSDAAANDDNAQDGKIATPIVEIKNMNSFRAVERAIDYEADRQYREWKETGRRLGQSPKQTRGWDDAAGVTRAQRSKEESSDYRYFPDPDLAPVVISAEVVAKVRERLIELPADLRKRLVADYGLSLYDADVIVNQGRPTVDYYLTVADGSGDAKSSANWLTQDVLRTLKNRELAIEEFSIPAERLSNFVKKIGAGELPSARGREVFELMADDGLEVDAAMDKLGIAQVDDSEIESLCQELLDANPKVVADVQGGKQQAIGALIGQAKKKNPNIDPGKFRATCLALIAKG
ncbi:Aspartyl/glutamyl-tRNA(Asn/Gln) amidotransferase subunit B [Posidoniimonas polymericola]|uniref:Aspartyl/glutamyl-tRNA(Asn/Gln) amidotransferase subunit B n=1 Tax=Posidoniimonas polymericola TaxID=2528002 RepID=A0A5C5YM88_9BACT|nr:Asp-tRNA(Asn)/Glu-tRNA(Gln) amidotransferase subunit GatB [Posidoniimonas polymericola]TWT76022.1 Aspartyl/glutamyl-tRNA(Asn/Gln) amidotransferase subunit B [Posidoniimonas polymericola]